MDTHAPRILLVSCLLVASTGAQAVWTQLTPASAPVGRTGTAYASDGTGLLIFGGGDGTSYLNDTWKFDGTNWTQLALTGTLPPGRYRHGAAWHLSAAQLVVFGGGLNNTGASRQSDTWLFDGAAWMQATPMNSPSARWWHAMSFDFVNNGVLLFGGQDATARLNDTWLWNGTDWTSLTPATQPPARERAAMATNFGTGQIVLFGGNPGTGELGDTWIWNGADWTQVMTSTIPYVTGTRNAGMTYDITRDRMVLFGGITGGVFQANTWEFDGVDWTDRGVSPLTPRTFPAIAYVLGLGKTYLFTGYGGVGVYYPDTWEYQTDQPGMFVTAGTGCSSAAGSPSIVGTTPWAGATMDVAVSGLATTALPVLTIGFSNTSWAGGSLPYNLGAFGAPTCDLLVSTDSNLFLPNAGGIASWSWAIPNNPFVFGFEFYTQAFAVQLGAGSFTIAASARGEVTIGAL